jgi:hypothetical protein
MATWDFGAISDALAAKFGVGVLATPTGADAIRSASAALPSGLGALPAVYVFADSGQLTQGGGSRHGEHVFLARLYYDQAAGGDLERDVPELQDWLGVMLDALKPGMQLSAQVDAARIVGWRIAILPYAGLEYTGLELRIQVVTSAGWTPTP